MENSKETTNNNEAADIVAMKDIPLKDVKWLWYPYIPLGKGVIMFGKAGEGKTYASLQIAAQCTTGRLLPGEIKAEPMNVIYLTAEDGYDDTIKPRLIDAGADESRVFIIKDNGKKLSMTDPRIEDAVKRTGAKLLIIDPMQAFLGADIDMNRANAVRVPVRHVCDMAAKYDCSVIFIGHPNKCRGIDILASLIGSSDFVATVRSVLYVGRYKKDPNIRVIIHRKSSLAPEGNSVAFRIDDGKGFKWLEGYDDVSELDLYNASGSGRGKGCTKLSKAAELIRKLVREAGGKALSKEVEKAVLANDIGIRTYAEARRQMPEITPKKIGSEHYLLLDESKIPVYTKEELKEIEDENNS